MPYRFLFVVQMLCGSAFAQDKQPQDPPWSKPPKLENLFTDDFEKDSRGDYTIGGKEGAVQWEKGKLTLSDGAILHRKIDAGSWVEMELDLEFPKLTEDGQTSDLKVWLDLEGATDSFVWFRQKREAEKTRSALFIVGTEGNWIQRPNQKLVSQPLVVSGPLANGKWTIRYRNGLWSLVGPNSKLKIFGYINNGTSHVKQTVIVTSTTAIQIRSAEFSKVKPVIFNPAPDIASKIEDAKSLNNQAVGLFRSGQARKAIEVVDKIRSVRRRLLGLFHPDYASSLNSLAVLNKSLGESKKSEKLYLEANALKEKTVGKDHPSYAKGLNNLASLYNSMGEYPKATPLVIEAKATLEKTLGKEHPSYATSLNNLASLYLSLGEYSKAEPLILEAKDIREKILGKEHPSYGVSLHNLASLYSLKGEYSRAESLYLEAKSVEEQVLGKEHPSYATSLNNLASLYLSLGEYSKAEPLFLEAKDIREKILGKEHPSYGVSLNNLALLYSSMGDYSRAETLALEANVTFEKALGQKHPDFATSLCNLSALYKSMGEYSKARQASQRAKEIREKVLGKEHPDYASSLDNLGNIYESTGDNDKAELLYREAKTIREKVLGKEHPAYATSLNNLAFYYKSIDEYSKSERLFVEANAVNEKILGKEHPTYATSLHNLAALRFLTNKSALAHKNASSAVSIRLQGLDRYSLIQSEAQQRKLLGQCRSNANMMLSIADQIPQQHASAFRMEILQKGSVLARQKSYRQLAQDADTAELFSELRSIASQLAKHTSSDPTKAKWKERNKFLLEEHEKLEKQIASQSAEFRRLAEPLEVDEYVTSLPNNSSLVNFTQFTKWIPQPEKNPKFQHVRHLAAFVVSSSEATMPKKVRMIDLGPVAPIEKSIAQWRKPIESANQNGRTIDATGQSSMKSAGADLRRMLWEPIENHLPKSESHMVIVSPDGPLGRFPLNALPGREKTFLLEERRIVSIPVPRLIPQMLEQSPVSLDENAKALLVGGIHYGKLEAGVKVEGLSFRNRSLLGKLQFGPLKGTGNEVNLIQKRFSSATLLTADQASEKTFISKASENQILHIATHGFFKSPREIKLPKTGEAGLVGFRNQQQTVSQNPNLLSGLAFANVNNAQNLKFDQAEDDGILYSAELAMLPMENVELAVLSACDTGLGQDDTPGEGLIGIQRAFQVAGAKTTVASYWKVDDRATQLLMNKFYENLLAYSKNADPEDLKNNRTTIRIDALRDAQLWMLNNPIVASTTIRGEPVEIDPSKIRKAEAKLKPADKNQRTHPRYWAAFMLSGDWR